MTSAKQLPTWGSIFGVLIFACSSYAEPHLALRESLRCSRCHTSPTGGGKRTAFGALYAASHLSLFGSSPRTRLPKRQEEDQSSGGTWLLTTLATGEVTSWFAIGADLRVSNTTTLGEEKSNTFESSQGTLYLELRPWPGRIVVYLDEQIAVGGARSREAWGLIHGPFSTYLRGGWFFPPFGLRILDDDTLTRRTSGANFANSDLGLEAGVDVGPFFVALAATNGSFSGADEDKLKAFYALFELNLDLGRAGLSWMYNPTDAGCRMMVGGYGGVQLGRFGLQGETVLIAERPAEKSRWGYQIGTFAELDLNITRGLGLRVGFDYHDADLELSQDRRLRFRLGIDLFLLRMVETKIYYVLRQAETEQPRDGDDMLEVMLHVYL